MHANIIPGMISSYNDLFKDWELWIGDTRVDLILGGLPVSFRILFAYYFASNIIRRAIGMVH